MKISKGLLRVKEPSLTMLLMGVLFSDVLLGVFLLVRDSPEVAADSR